MINTVRFPQLSPNFIFGVVAENEFVKESKELLHMLIGSIGSSACLSGFPSRSDSSRAIGPEVYVFKLYGIGQNIMKYQFLSFIFIDIKLIAISIAIIGVTVVRLRKNIKIPQNMQLKRHLHCKFLHFEQVEIVVKFQ